MPLVVIVSVVIGLFIGFILGKKFSVAGAIIRSVEDNSKGASDNREVEPPAYIVVMVKDYQPEKMQPYLAALPPIYEKHNATFVSMATEVDVLEGEFAYKGMLVSKWPSVEAAQNFWDSEDYQAAKSLREGLGEFNIFILKGLPDNFGK